MYLVTLTTWSFSGHTSKTVLGAGLDVEQVYAHVKYNWPTANFPDDMLGILSDNGEVDSENFRNGMHESYVTIEKIDEIRG